MVRNHHKIKFHTNARGLTNIHKEREFTAVLAKLILKVKLSLKDLAGSKRLVSKLGCLVSISVPTGYILGAGAIL